MDWRFIVALVVAVPIILLPVAFVWYLNIGGVLAAMREARRKRARWREETKQFGPGRNKEEAVREGKSNT